MYATSLYRALGARLPTLVSVTGNDAGISAITQSRPVQSVSVTADVIQNSYANYRIVISEGEVSCYTNIVIRTGPSAGGVRALHESAHIP